MRGVTALGVSLVLGFALAMPGVLTARDARAQAPEGPATTNPASTAAPSAVPAAATDAVAADADVTSGEAEAERVAAALAASLSLEPSAPELAQADEFELSLYGFTDFTFSQVLNHATFSPPYSTFLVGNINLYVGANLGSRFRSLVEFRLLYVPHGSIPSDELYSPTAVRMNTTVRDPADFGRPQRWGGVEIERAWLEYAAHPWLTVRVGQWLTPYGIWNVDHGSPVVIGVRKPYVLGEELFPERQTGVLAFGSTLVGTTELGYALGISNGRGPVDAYQDLDNDKAVTARLFASHDSPIGNITLGATMFRGRYTDRLQRFGITPAGEIGFEYLTQSRYDEFSAGADLRWLWHDLVVQGEFLLRQRATDDRFRPPGFFPGPGVIPGFEPDFQSIGYYGMAGYRLPWFGVMPFFGGENYAPGRELAPTAAAFWGGLNVRPTPRVVLKTQVTKSWITGGTRLSGPDGLFALDTQAAWSF